MSKFCSVKKNSKNAKVLFQTADMYVVIEEMF